MQFGLNEAYLCGLDVAPSNKYEAVLTFDGDPSTAGNQPLDTGSYILTASDAIQDLFGNALDGDVNGSPGGSFTRTFSVYYTAPPPPPPPSTDTIVNAIAWGGPARRGRQRGRELRGRLDAVRPRRRRRDRRQHHGPAVRQPRQPPSAGSSW